VAFEDDRDERASVPDHRHRCYAEARPAPRALAHQQAYCLSSAFPVCPTFQDWARREAARARDAAAAAKGAEPTGAAPGGGAALPAAATGAAGLAAGGAAGRATGTSGASGLAASGAAGLAAGEAFSLPIDEDDDSAPDPGASESDHARSTAPDDAADEADTGDADELGARRNPPRDWAAPPPWLASDEREGAGTAGTPPFLSHRTPEPGQGLAGSAADWLAGGPAPTAPPGAAAASSAAGVAGPAARGRPDSSDPRGAADDHVPGDHEHDEDLSRRPARRARAYEQHLGGTDGPDWERPRRYEAYPSIRTRVALPNMSRLAVMAGAIAIAAIALFFLPAILGIGSGSGSGPAASTTPSSVAASASLLPTDVPAPTPVLYTIKKNDILSRVASAHGVTLAELLAANPTIKNPNKITEGQQIIIPVPSQASDQVGGSGGASASP
jgi:hypothetical protein